MVLSMSVSLTWCVKSCCYQRNCALISSSYRRWTWWRCLLDIEETGFHLRHVTVRNNKSTWEGDWSRVWFMDKSLFSKWIVFIHMHWLILIWCDIAHLPCSKTDYGMSQYHWRTGYEWTFHWLHLPNKHSPFTVSFESVQESKQDWMRHQTRICRS